MRVLMAVLAALSIFVTGCESAAGSGSELAGTAWQLTGWSANSPDPAPFNITAAFDDTKISGRSAVNRYGGPYSATAGGDFSVGELQTTLMAGSEEATHAEQIHFELLRQVRKYAVNGTTLTLLDGGNNALLIFTKK